ncbi:stage III sporulation protein SpoIIIAB [Thermovenabulum gondwanense]|uniref:Stage III sporulation protein AB n=1 Tax=Thermovenabulum gondwanense TaxID=520767 RepID=A0A162MGV2_9FIRM|nr:stage III sporulation protein SpoIIIAB [Thermovenabulum gondwanense]KYO65826.1 hypothetical protein ATZ99_14640 [Thermovenabulum gondwanense]
MWFKIIGGLLILFSSSSIGFIVAKYYGERPKLLRQLQNALSMLETEINYSNSPLPEALRNVALRCDKDVSFLFSKTKEYINSTEGLTAAEAWEKALKAFSRTKSLNETDMEILDAFGKYLGTSDREDQINKLRLTLSQLRSQEHKAIEEKEKNERVWKYLGVMTGLLIVLLLI